MDVTRTKTQEICGTDPNSVKRKLRWVDQQNSTLMDGLREDISQLRQNKRSIRDMGGTHQTRRYRGWSGAICCWEYAWACPTKVA